MKEEPDILGHEAAEAEDISESTGSTGNINTWDGVERRWLRHKRWADQMTRAELEEMIREITRQVTP